MDGTRPDNSENPILVRQKNMMAIQTNKRIDIIYQNYMPVLHLCQQYQMIFLRQTITNSGLYFTRCEEMQLQQIQEEVVPSLDLLQNAGPDEYLINGADLHEFQTHAGLLERTRL